MVETAIALPLILMAGLFLCEFYFASVRYFVAADGFAIASRRLAIPITVLTTGSQGEIPVCSELAEQTMRASAISKSPGLEGLKLKVTQLVSDRLDFQASVQNECVVCRAAGVHFALSYSFNTIVQLPAGTISCKPDLLP